MVGGQGAVGLDGVTRRYRLDAELAITALDAVTLEVPAGAAVALSGPSGSGKSTLLHLVGALERADEGTVTVGGRELLAAVGLEGRETSLPSRLSGASSSAWRSPAR